MIVQCATFSKSVNPWNINKSVSDIRIRFPFESRFWISVSGCKLTILPDIQQENRIVIISDACFQFRMRAYPIFFTEFNSKSQTSLKDSFARTKFIVKKLWQRNFTKSLCFLFKHCMLCIHWRYAPASTPKAELSCNCKTQKNYSSK